MKVTNANFQTVWESMRMGHACHEFSGGKFASQHLRVCLEVQSAISRGELGLTESELLQLNRMIHDWRAALVRHNTQDYKFVEYDTQTGLPKKGD